MSTFPRSRDRQRRVVVMVFDGVVTLDALGPYEVFRLARDEDGGSAYDVVIAGPEPGPVRTESGVLLHAEYGLGDLHPHTLVVPGSSMGIDAACIRPPVVRAVAAARSRVQRLVGICTGAFALAAVGALDGKRATTHWSRIPDLRRRHPAVQVDSDAIFVRDGDVWTSAGVTAGIDLALALVEADFGHAVALEVARELVVFLRRPGGQSQFSHYLRAPPEMDDRIARVVRWLPDHLHEPLPTSELARRAGMSPRNFRRVFTRTMGLAPGRFVDRARVEAAAGILESSDESVAALAARFGFGTEESLRRAFHRWLGVAPRDYRARFR